MEVEHLEEGQIKSSLSYWFFKGFYHLCTSHYSFHFPATFHDNFIDVLTYNQSFLMEYWYLPEVLDILDPYLTDYM